MNQGLRKKKGGKSFIVHFLEKSWFPPISCWVPPSAHPQVGWLMGVYYFSSPPCTVALVSSPEMSHIHSRLSWEDSYCQSQLPAFPFSFPLLPGSPSIPSLQRLCLQVCSDKLRQRSQAYTTFFSFLKSGSVWRPPKRGEVKG